MYMVMCQIYEINYQIQKLVHPMFITEDVFVASHMVLHVKSDSQVF